MFYRSKTVLLQSKLSASYNDVTSINMTRMQLLNTNHEPVIIFDLYHTDVHHIHIKDTSYSFVQDMVYDKTMRNFISKLIGYTVPKCVSRYIILKNSRPVAKVFLDNLYNRVKFRCDPLYKWEATEKEDTYNFYKNVTPEYLQDAKKSQCLLAVLDTLGVDAECFSKPENLHNIDLCLNNESYSIDRKSLPLYLG